MSDDNEKIPVHAHQQADLLALRLGLTPPRLGRWETVILPGMLKILDRIEALEGGIKPTPAA
jgi:hypothetical protein